MRTIRILLAGLLAAAAISVAAPGAGADSASLTNGDGILIADSGEGSPYPSTIEVTDVGGTITDVDVTLNGLSHTWPSDIVVILESPDGDTTLLINDCGSSDNIDAIDLTFDDESGVSLSAPLTTGSFVPTVGCDGSFIGTDPTIPAGPWGADLSSLDGGSPNGTWNLYVWDDFGGDEGAMTGWSLDIETTNTAPSTEDAAYETDEDTPLVVDAASGLASATTDPDDDDDIDFAVVSGPANGTLDLDADKGAFTYTPDPDFTGVDTFTFTADDNVLDDPILVLSNTTTYYQPVAAASSDDAKSDGDAGSGQGTPPATYQVERKSSDGVRAAAISGPSTVTITVQPVNDPPVAVDDEAETTSGTSVTIDAVANDTDVDGDTLSVDSVSDPINGTVTIDGGDVTYVPDDDFVGTEVLTYVVTDGTATDEATITVTVTAAEVDDDGDDNDGVTTTTTGAVAGTGTLPRTGADGGPLGAYGLFAVFLVLSGMAFATAGAVRSRMHQVGRHLDI